jgi:hypothetical protein
MILMFDFFCECECECDVCLLVLCKWCKVVRIRRGSQTSLALCLISVVGWLLSLL